MSYDPTVWKDEIVSDPLRYDVIPHPDGSITLVPKPGTIVQEGTPINAANMNKLEQALVSHLAEEATLTQAGHVKHATLSTTLNTAWSGASAPFTKTQTVSGILSTDTPIIDVVMSGTFATDEARQEAWGYVYRAVTSANAITFYATEKPTVDLPLQIKVVR